MAIVGEFVSILTEFEARAASHCSVNEVRPVGNESERVLKGKKYKYQEVTLTDVLRVTMDIAASTPLGGHLPKGVLEIFINPKELYCVDRGSSKIVKTTTEVGYVHTDALSSTTRLLLGLHYDYDVEANGEPGNGHPTYHVQITNKLFTLTDFLSGLGIDVANCTNLPFLRVPTAQMSLPSILVGVAADCFSHEDFKDFIMSVRKKPSPELFQPNKLLERIKGNACSFAASSWYRS